jgi:hypothetical protein
MNILEYDKEERKCYRRLLNLYRVGLAIVLWIVLAILSIPYSLPLAILATLAGYPVARQAYRLLLIVTGREWASENEKWAIAGIRRTTRQEKLKKIATIARDASRRRLAITGITDPLFLTDRAIRDPSWEVRFAAAEGVEDTACLEKLARVAPDGITRHLLIRRITNQEIFAERAINDPYHETRLAAIARTTHLPTLEDRAINDPCRDVREAATRRLLKSGTASRATLETIAAALTGETAPDGSAGYLQAIRDALANHQPTSN